MTFARTILIVPVHFWMSLDSSLIGYDVGDIGQCWGCPSSGCRIWIINNISPVKGICSLWKAHGGLSHIPFSEILWCPKVSDALKKFVVVNHN